MMTHSELKTRYVVGVDLGTVNLAVARYDRRERRCVALDVINLRRLWYGDGARGPPGKLSARACDAALGRHLRQHAAWNGSDAQPYVVGIEQQPHFGGRMTAQVGHYMAGYFDGRGVLCVRVPPVSRAANVKKGTNAAVKKKGSGPKTYRGRKRKADGKRDANKQQSERALAVERARNPGLVDPKQWAQLERTQPKRDGKPKMDDAAEAVLIALAMDRSMAAELAARKRSSRPRKRLVA